MKRCIQLAKNGLGSTYPNPLVGSVLVYKNVIIGEGWHYAAGKPHAEVHAIQDALTSRCTAEILASESIASPQELIAKCTMYVSLEPCSHFGKTPPCANMIVASGIKQVVVGNLDPNPKVSGRGIQKLKDAGCTVIEGILDSECFELNKRFFTFQTKKRPYIVLKWAQSKDGFIAPNTKDKPVPVWITNTFSRQQVHQLRAQEQGILIGTTTALDDNPSLTTRDWYGSSPTRIVIDRDLKIPITASIFNTKAPTFIITENKINDTTFPHSEIKTITFQKELAAQLCTIAFENNIQSLIIEGGTKTLQTFINENLWDEALVFSGKTNFKSGTKAPTLKVTSTLIKTIKEDTLNRYKNNHQ